MTRDNRGQFTQWQPARLLFRRVKSKPHQKGHETRRAKRSAWVWAHVAALTPCQHRETFFWPLLHDGSAVFGCDACLTCGAGQPPFAKGAVVPVPGEWRAVMA